jgi:hypothetical protein
MEMVRVSKTVLVLMMGTGVMTGLAAEEVPPVPLPSTSVAPSQPVLPKSLLVKRDHTTIKQKPTTRIKRRGVVMKGTRLPVFEQQTGFGCRNVWYRTDADGWICGEDVEPSTEPPAAEHYPKVPPGGITPWPYGFVRETTLEYKNSGGQMVEVRELQKGFGFGIAGMVRALGVRYFRTAEKTLIPRSAAGMTDRISTFEGMPLKEGKPWPLGFVNSRQAFAYSESMLLKSKRIGKVDRYTPFQVLETRGRGTKRFVRFDEGAWLRARDVQVARDAPLPKRVKPGERWIDIDTKSQMMTAYEGTRPVYTTLISSGRFSSRTVRGEYRIWAKVAAIAMDNTDEVLEEEPLPSPEEVSAVGDSDAGALPPPPVEVRHLYSLRDVPWTQFFFESYALHGVYWHNGFGNRKSHGCVNLSPKDAKWLYEWTSPRVPPGWWAIHATDSDPGTLVRVR